MVQPLIVVGGRQVFPFELPVIKSLVADHWSEGVRAIAGVLCRHWSWVRLGSLYIEGARRVLLALAYRGFIQLPEEKRPWKSLATIAEVRLDDSPMEGRLSDFLPVHLRLVQTVDQNDIFDAVMRQYHYLGSRRVIGEHLKYLASIENRPVAALLWGRAAFKIGARDRFLGWRSEQRIENLGRIANNYRFLILPWVRVRYLASHVLALNVKVISADWRDRFGIELECLETFVDPERFRATCYRAANWIDLGHTRGSGRGGSQYRYHGHPKRVLVYPLSPALRQQRTQSRTLNSRDTSNSLRQTVLPEPSFGKVAEMSLNDELGQAFTGQLSIEQLQMLVEDLEAYCGRFHDLFPRSEPRQHFGVAMRGLMSSLEKKNIEYIALKSGAHIPVRTLQHFITSGKWGDEAVRIRHQEFVAQTLRSPQGVLITDGCDFPKKGQDSCGVSRQYCGATGKIDNCQAGVFVAYANPDGLATFLDGQLYMPEKWFNPEQKERRWDACHIPPDLQFQTKPQLAVKMIQGIHARGSLSARYVLADEGFGNCPEFLDGLPEGVSYFCEVARTTHVWPTAGDQSVEVQNLRPGLNWYQGVSIKEGAHGPILADVARQRVIDVRKRKPRSEVWLYLRRNPSTEEHKYYLSNLPPDTPLEEMVWLSGMRWPIETCNQEGKDYLGMDHYQVRTWTGWHHHMTLVFLSHHFLTHLRLQGKKNAFMASNS